MANFLIILISILIPPLGVAFEVGFTKHFWVNLILTILGYVPGLVHAIYVVASKRPIKL